MFTEWKWTGKNQKTCTCILCGTLIEQQVDDHGNPTREGYWLGIHRDHHMKIDNLVSEVRYLYQQHLNQQTNK